MSIESLKAALPDYAKDIKLNLSAIASDQSLGDQRLWGTLLASALATRQPQVIAAVEAEARQRLSPEAVNAAKAAHAVMAMNNVYYRFVHLVAAKDYATLPARLRMNVMANPGVEKADFELWSLAVSAINGCGKCMDSHEAELRKHGLSVQEVQTAVRAAAVIHSVAATLDGEQVSAGVQSQAA
ncbi:MAG: carboxymuconolactone decarboxylase family protein [Alphaproteobacteria bacterium]|nr:carboxymuconolactone decarboxylase family protein [Alphaproteobacteria bacterium]